MEKEKDKKDIIEEKKDELECKHPRRCWFRQNVLTCFTCNPHPKVLRG